MNLKKESLAVAMASSITLLAGCQSTTNEPQVPANSNLQSEEVNVAASSYLQSCLLGGLGGALVGYLAGNDAQSAVIGGLSGCALFMGGNALLDQLREDYVSTEDQLDGLIQVMQDNNKKAHKLVIAAQQSYKEDHRKMQNLMRDISRDRASIDEIKHSIAYCDSNIKLLNDNIAQHEEALASYRQAARGLQDGYLSYEAKQKIRACNKRIAQLENDIEQIRLTCNNYVRDRDVLNLAYNEALESQSRA